MLKKTALNQADNIVIFQSCLLPKMRLSVFLEGRLTGYKCSQALLCPLPISLSVVYIRQWYRFWAAEKAMRQQTRTPAQEHKDRFFEVIWPTSVCRQIFRSTQNRLVPLILAFLGGAVKVTLRRHNLIWSFLDHLPTSSHPRTFKNLID